MTKPDDRAEKNRRIAELLEPMPNGTPWTVPLISPRGGWCNSTPAICDGRHVYTWVPRDFYTDEDANALLLEAMPAVELYKHPPDSDCDGTGWRCRPDWGLDESTYHSDRKAAVAGAFLKWKGESR